MTFLARQAPMIPLTRVSADAMHMPPVEEAARVLFLPVSNGALPEGNAHRTGVKATRQSVLAAILPIHRLRELIWINSLRDARQRAAPGSPLDDGRSVDGDQYGSSRRQGSWAHSQRCPAMNLELLKQRVQRLLERADVRVDGNRPWDIRVRDEAFYPRVLAHGSMGLGESFMDGCWESGALDTLIFRLLRAQLDRQVRTFADIWAVLRAKMVNLQGRRRAFQVGEKHYDLGNDLYRAMLGERMVYSCAYWRNASSLDAAQEAKLDLVCRKLGLQPGMRVLDIGCGWGEALKFAVERYGVTAVGVTVSGEQAEFARELCRGLPIEFRLQDYRDVDERFDRILSIGMFEHVGVKNYRRYFEVARRNLADDGLFLLHTIGGNTSSVTTDPWIEKYIFPNSMLPSAEQIAAASEGLFVLEDWHNFGTDYERTLAAWRDNVERAWPTLDTRYDERFRRMWRYYLAASIGSFRARQIQLWQLVLSPNGVPGGYVAPR
jgi:cyclopropane-fatty-acyl-phospholipid synthase